MHGHVWRYVVHLLGDPVLAQDVSQEVFIRVHRKLGTLRDPDRFVPWLMTIARNAATTPAGPARDAGWFRWSIGRWKAEVFS